MLDHGICAELAARLGVHRSTIWRDIRAIIAEGNPTVVPCPHCGKPVPPHEITMVDVFGDTLPPQEPERDRLTDRILDDIEAEEWRGAEAA